ncbi:MAG: ATP-binding protein [Hyphomonadaceae bacterium]|nr:ATP-binding protein [Hyphomonadaceae bacterium]
MAAIERKADANPTKAFFVRIITKDISLEDCILDLIDNSVDGAWRCEGSRPIGLQDGTDLSKYSIMIEATPDKFSIIDNCGGMSLDDAVEHAFSFGREATEDHDDYSIGVYGIGMKRAVFKLGGNIRVRSTYDDKGTRSAFAVPINVSKWLSNDKPPWDFDIEEDELLPNNGVEIVVQELTPGAAGAFESPAFLQGLRRTIARDYALHLNRGLRISLNGSEISGWKIELRQSEDFQPMRLEYKDKADNEEVSIEIIGGMAAPPPESNDPEEEADNEKQPHGWYVVCNGRIVLAGDKTAISGWGTDDWPNWHPQYAGFIGIILFTAANAAALPLTTTKRSVDITSDIYRRARPKMREVSTKWIAYTNQRKQAADEAKAKEALAVPVSIYSVAKRATVALPALVSRPAGERLANVHYSVPVSRLKKLAKELGGINMSNREVGLKSFNYTYDDLVGGE